MTAGPTTCAHLVFSTVDLGGAGVRLMFSLAPQSQTADRSTDMPALSLGFCSVTLKWGLGLGD